MHKLNKELDEIISKLEFEEGGGIRITGIDWYSDDVRVEFSINTGVDGQSQLWEIQINGVRSNLIKSEYADRIELFEEHPLLWPFNQLQTSLYFSRSTARPYELFESLYRVHMQVTKKWFSFDKYINTNVSIIELCKSTAGLFASGPIMLLAAYKKEFETHAMSPTIVGGYDPKNRVNNQWIEEKDQLKVLIIGDSYVVAETFEFSKA